MIYVDSSVVLAELGQETFRMLPDFWADDLFASRLMQAECYVRINAKPEPSLFIERFEEILEHVVLFEISNEILERLKKPFNVSIRTLDALHLATALFLKEATSDLELATFDKTLARAAEAEGLKVRSA